MLPALRMSGSYGLWKPVLTVGLGAVGGFLYYFVVKALNADIDTKYRKTKLHGIRPVVIVSNDSANRHSTVFHAVPLTSKIHKKTYLPTHIFISSFKAVGLRTNSIAQCEQLCDVKDTDLIEKIGKVSKNQLRQITKGMQIQLGMSTKHNNPIA